MILYIVLGMILLWIKMMAKAFLKLKRKIIKLRKQTLVC